MRLKQLAFAVLCSGALVAPVLAQENPLPKSTGAGNSYPTTTTTTMPNGASKTVPSTQAPGPGTGGSTAGIAPGSGTATMTNINTASATELDKLPQIGRARAAAIIKGRPYRTTDDLLTKKVLSKGVFERIKDKITA